MKIPSDLTDRIKVSGHLSTVQANWTGSCETTFLITLEAYRRFLEVTEDPRQASVLTMAWASLEGGERANPGL